MLRSSSYLEKNPNTFSEHFLWRSPFKRPWTYVLSFFSYTIHFTWEKIYATVINLVDFPSINFCVCLQKQEEHHSKANKRAERYNLSTSLSRFTYILFFPALFPVFNSMWNCASCLIVFLLSSVHLSPLGVEAQSPPIAAGHRSLCPWRRQPTYCQLALKWRTFHHPTENTIKNTRTLQSAALENQPLSQV